MKWSWRIGRVAGIDVNLHATFLILLGWVGLSHYLERQNFADVAGGLAFIIALFGIVLLHELGHALTARRYGIQTRDITLLPIGGVARLERMPENPKQELLVALAGPAVNVALAIILFAILVPAEALAPLSRVQLVGGHFLAKLLWVNVALAVFNLIPAFPMDGGRVLRALLAMRMDYVRATDIAASIGQGVALIFGFIGLFWNPFLVFIALFVWMGAAAEASMVQIKSALGGIPINRAMITDFRTLSPGDSLQAAVEYVLAGFQQDFPVVLDGRLVGVLTRADLLKTLAQKGQQALVREAMKSEFETADPAEMLENLFSRLQNCSCHSLPVVRAGNLVGIVTMENVGEFLMIQSALRGQEPMKMAPGSTA
ncbi:MAG: site-2 protease family protein [Planctomycetes bacterium]|nr:site-2 protease family protein [Planctomycetota bacterium]